MPEVGRQLAHHHGVARRLPVGGNTIALLDVPAAGAVEHVGTAVLLPGYTGSKEDFAPLLGPLSRLGWRVVAVDLPGQYESSGPADRSAYAVDLLAQTVLEVSRLLIPDGPAHLLGHSFGGLVARAAVLAEPAAWRSVTLLDSGPAGIGGLRRERLDSLEPLLATGGVAAVYEATERLDLADPAYVAYPQAVKDFLRTRFLATSAASLQGMADALRGEPDRVDALHATGVPVLVCYGEADDAWSPAEQAEMAGRLGAAHVVIPDAVHSPAIQHTEPTVRAIADFWARTSRLLEGAAACPGPPSGP